MQGADLVSVATRKLYANHRHLYYTVLQTNPSQPTTVCIACWSILRRLLKVLRRDELTYVSKPGLCCFIAFYHHVSQRFTVTEDNALLAWARNTNHKFKTVK